MVHRIPDPMAGGSRPSSRHKIVSPAEAVRLVQDGDTIATGGFVGIAFRRHQTDPALYASREEAFSHLGD